MSELQDHRWLAQVATTGDASDVTALEQERDEARAELERLKAWNEELHQAQERWEKRLGAALAECERLRARLESAVAEWGRVAGALAVFADQSRWLYGADGAWLAVGENRTLVKPWAVAREALAPKEAAG